MELYLMARAKCSDCGAKTLGTVPIKLDSRNTVIASEHDVELPDGWTQVGGYEDDGTACPECSAKRAKAKKEKAAKEAEAKAKAKAKREAKKAAKAAEEANKDA
jgi:DNA-directed RNA polymerase subunit RPC12/RpoP